jgi:hypothetical protein
MLAVQVVCPKLSGSTTRIDPTPSLASSSTMYPPNPPQPTTAIRLFRSFQLLFRREVCDFWHNGSATVHGEDKLFRFRWVR